MSEFRECVGDGDALIDVEGHNLRIRHGNDATYSFSPGMVVDDWVELCKERAALKKEIEKLSDALQVEAKRADDLDLKNMCPVCAGLGDPTSGKPCMCAGTGKASDAVPHLLGRLAMSEARTKAESVTVGDRGRLVEVFEMVQERNSDRLSGVEYKKKSRGPARFHGWGVEYEEFDGGPGNFTIAIVEFSDGTVDTVMLGFIRFLKGKG